MGLANGFSVFIFVRIATSLIFNTLCKGWFRCTLMQPQLRTNPMLYEIWLGAKCILTVPMELTDLVNNNNMHEPMLQHSVDILKQNHCKVILVGPSDIS